MLADGSISGCPSGQLAFIETPKLIEDYIGRARSQNDAKLRAHRCIEAAAEATRLGAARGLTGA